jgi:hypothetical protein
MKMFCRIRNFLLIVISSLSIFSGCIYSRAKTAGIEPNVSLLRSSEYEIVGESETQISNMSLLWFVSVTPRPDYNSAILEMVNEKGGDDIIDVRMWIEKQHWVFGTVTIMHIKGRIIKYKDSLVEIQK